MDYLNLIFGGALLAIPVIFIMNLLINRMTNMAFKDITKGFVGELDEYLTQHQSCKTEKGIKCFKCGSLSLKNLGAHSRHDTLRLVSCNSCSTKLFYNITE